MKTSQLEQRSAIEILFYLVENREAIMTELMRELRRSQHPIYEALNILKKLGLIEERLATEPLRRIYFLTDRGQRVASKLIELEAILSEVSNNSRG